MASDGLLLWANSIRTTMASDKARTEFAEHMQSRGFSWLDQYLGDVLEKARDGDEELFDLMKTPGRKKTIVRKVPTTGSRLKNMVAVDENDEDADSKENVAPAQNTFYKALLAAKSPEPAKPFSSPNNQPSSPLPDQTVRRISAHPREPSPPLPTPTLHYQDSLGFPHFPHMDPAALSMIVEDDEGSARNTSRTSNAAERGPLQPAANRFLQGVAEEVAEEDMQAIRPLSLASTADTFHSVPMSPEEKITEQAQEPAVVASSGPSGSGAPAQETSRSRQESETPAPPSPPAARASVEPSTWSSIAAPLPDVSKAKASQDVVMAEPAVEPAQQYTDVLVPLRDEDTAGPRPPSPLRKSLRAVREQSSGAILVGNATPGPVAGGQRTSWLMKTRAVSRKVSGLGGPTHVPRTTLGGMKRKSEDTMHIPGLPSEDDTRHHKALKMLETDAASNKPLEYAEPTLPTSEFASATEDGIIDRLRKTMQGMKPIAPVSNDALADAKASAEAKVAERHQADISIISTADPLSLARTSSAPASDRAAPANRTSSRRMSVSELIPANEKGVVFKPPLPPHPAARGEHDTGQLSSSQLDT
ncbi:hypothetical protein BD626DRAFT_566927 [Schizophyllum amplum]|uniref:Inner centromere protein ARK-binding domain-containing protein n=1 Tax=Schizophyllum amplum TaxID=97359 RepID=A0A550CND7_9AGAR|nr:hypothetical protein BD626DRAFT_566927 [Auriculariopsis ampla]